MADIEVRRTHGLGLKGARAAAEKMAGDLDRRFGLSGDWVGNTLKFGRPGLSGSLDITEKDLHLSVVLGFLFKAMKGSIESAVRQELDQLFVAHRADAAPEKPARAAAPKAKKAAPSPKKSR